MDISAKSYWRIATASLSSQARSAVTGAGSLNSAEACAQIVARRATRPLSSASNSTARHVVRCIGSDQRCWHIVWHGPQHRESSAAAHEIARQREHGQAHRECIETRVAAREAKTVECKRAVRKHGEKVNTTSLRQSHDAFRDVDTERCKMVAKVGIKYTGAAGGRAVKHRQRSLR